MRCSRSDRVKGWREGCRRQEDWRGACLLFSLPLHPHPFRALLTGGAWLVMSREVARLAGTNRLPPLIVYDVAIPPSPTSISLPPLCLSPLLSLFLHPSLPVFMGSLWFIRGSVEVRATESRGVFYCSWCVKRPTHSIPARPFLTCQYWLIHLEWSCSIHCMEATTCSDTLVNGRM